MPLLLAWPRHFREAFSNAEFELHRPQVVSSTSGRATSGLSAASLALAIGFWAFHRIQAGCLQCSTMPPSSPRRGSRRVCRVCYLIDQKSGARHFGGHLRSPQRESLPPQLEGQPAAERLPRRPFSPPLAID